MSSPVVNNEIVKNEFETIIPVQGEFRGRKVTEMPASHLSKEIRQITKCQKVTFTVVSLLGAGLMIAGWTMYGLQKPRCDQNSASDCNKLVMNSGLGLGITGAVLIGGELLAVAVIGCCVYSCLGAILMPRTD